MKNYVILLFILFSYCKSFSQKIPKKIKSKNLYTENNQVFSKDSIPLSGFYKIKYSDFRNRHKSEISHFKDGFRIGNSKKLRFNKLEEQGTYTNGLKHGTWKEYFYKYGTLELTTEYKNGLKNGKEFGKQILSGYFICKYVNDTIDGALLKYGYNGYLESKEYFEKGEKIYELKYDEFLNVIEENNFHKKNNEVIVRQKKKEWKNETYIDSFYYKNDNVLAKGWYTKKRIPFKIKRYKNDTIYLKKEIVIQKDTTHKNKNNYTLTVYYDDFNRKRNTSIRIYYNNYLHRLKSIKEVLILNHGPDYNPCALHQSFDFLGNADNVHLYATYRKKGAIYEVEYKNDKCTTKEVTQRHIFRNTY